jgi:DNA-binding IclR family transcriptional regulator
MSSDKSLTVAKAISLLHTVADSHTPLTLSEIVSRSGLAKTVVLRMLASLREARLVERDPDTDRYRLGVGLIKLAQDALNTHPLHLQVGNWLETAVRQTGFTGLLMTKDGNEALYIDEIPGNTYINVAVGVGYRSALYCGGGPFTLLSFSNDEFIEEYIKHPLEKRTARTVVDPDKIRERVREARSQGYVVSYGDLFDDIAAAAVPIFAKNGALLGSMSITAVISQMTIEKCHEIGRMLKQLTQQSK